MSFKNRVQDAVIALFPSNRIVAEYYRRSTGKPAEWKRQPVAMSAKEIKDWKNGLMEATDPDNPRRGTLARFYENMKTDLHLMSCVDNRILPVQCAPYKLVDNAGNEDKEAHKLLERPWHLDCIKIVCSHTFEGTKLLEIFELNEKMELARISEVPQTNFIPQKGIILYNEYDRDGVSYKSGAYKDFYTQIGNDWDLGLFSQIAIIIIAKKLGLGSWMGYIDKYGVPPLFAITDRMDTARRDELFEMLEQFRQNHFAVLQGNEKIETPQGYNVDAHNTFKSLMDDICNKEITKRIQGGTGTSDEKSFVGSAEVHERLLKYRHIVDRLLYKFYFNEEIKPRLVKLSPVYAPLANLTFEWDETETLSIKELLNIIKDLSAYYEFDIKELIKLTGLPFTKVKSLLGGLPGVEDTDETEEDEDDDTDDPKPGKQKKNPDGNALNNFNIYAATWDVAIQKLAGQLYDGKIKPSDLHKDLVLKTYDKLSKSAAEGWGKGYYSHDVARKMRENLLQFSGAKVNRTLEEIAALKNTGLNKEDFLSEAKKISDRQNGQYLDVESNYSARSAQSAKDWQRFEAEKDVLPNLTFRTMQDDDVRPHHAILEGMTKPVDDSAWSQYTPPLDPNCRCWLEQSTAPATQGTPNYAPNPQYASNPGKTGKAFSDTHSYFQMDKAIKNQVMRNSELMKEYLPYNSTIAMKNGKNVFINDFADLADLEQNKAAAKKIVKELNKDVYIRPHFESGNAPGRRNPEFGIGKANTKGDLKTYRPIVDGKPVTAESFINNSIQTLNKQKAEYGVLDFSAFNGSQKELKKALINRLYGSTNEINRNVKQVIIIQNNKVVQISRKQITKKDFKNLKGLN